MNPAANWKGYEIPLYGTKKRNLADDEFIAGFHVHSVPMPRHFQGEQAPTTSLATNWMNPQIGE
jgi:hypothetical protein